MKYGLQGFDSAFEAFLQWDGHWAGNSGPAGSSPKWGMVHLLPGPFCSKVTESVQSTVPEVQKINQLYSEYLFPDLESRDRVC